MHASALQYGAFSIQRIETLVRAIRIHQRLRKAMSRLDKTRLVADSRAYQWTDSILYRL